MNSSFDFKQALEQLKLGKPLNGEDGVLTPLIKQLAEAVLNAEIESHLDNQEEPNRRNGYSRKKLKTSAGEIELETPRDRAGSFEPQFVKKNQTRLNNEIEDKIVALYAYGNSYRDIASHLKEIYGLEMSIASISAITDKIIPLVKQWQQRPLDAVYPFVWLDAIHYKILNEGRYETRAIYTVLGLNMQGRKDVLGLYVSESEGANFWLSVLTDLNNRGVQDILIASVDGLKGFPEAIAAIFPGAQTQLCVVHQIRNSLRYVASKNHKAFMADLKLVYRANTIEQAQDALDRLESIWGDKYPIVIKSWRSKWEHLSNYFKYSEPIRRIMYTTNSIEAVHRQFRKLTKTKSCFPSDMALLKLLFLGIENAKKKWTMPIHNWPQAISQLDIHFPGRLNAVTLI